MHNTQEWTDDKKFVVLGHIGLIQHIKIATYSEFVYIHMDNGCNLGQGLSHLLNSRGYISKSGAKQTSERSWVSSPISNKKVWRNSTPIIRCRITVVEIKYAKL